jgi:thiamine biosynthesis lipoprotein ApbE
MMIFLGATTGGAFDPGVAPMYALIGYAAFERQRCQSPRRSVFAVHKRQLGITNRSVPWPQINNQTGA